MQTTTVRALAPARVCLHTWTSDTGAPVAALWAFADIGDEMRLAAGPVPMLTAHGEMAEDLPAEERSEILAAARWVAGKRGLRIDLDVEVPSGFGGAVPRVGAVLRGLGRLFGEDVTGGEDALGVAQAAARFPRAIKIAGGGAENVVLPALHAVLIDPVNGRVEPASEVLSSGQTGALPSWDGAEAFAAWLGSLDGAFATAAREIWPEVEEALDELALLPGCRVARVSGQGPGCFGLFPDRNTAEAAAGMIAALKPMWWVKAATLG